ncbi:MAG: NADP-dependent oxidoreductase [Rhodospirillales bacterium]|nr:NADP-dependent oxidoreductase [Rhodospirillales bacterium]
MSEIKSREVHLASRPVGTPTRENFDIIEAVIPPPQDGELLIKNLWMSVDPAMRPRMVDRKSYVTPYEIGKVLDGRTIGKVVQSGNPDYEVGAYVFGTQGWREFYVSNGDGLTKIDPGNVSVQAYLGALGMTGLTAYVGLLRIGEIKPGETVFVSAAAGAVGSIACQIAKNNGCRVVASAGSDEKVAWLKDVAGVDAAFNYKTAPDIGAEIARLCPDGIDVEFENVGGAHLEGALAQMNEFGRVVLCGMISTYNETEAEPGPRGMFLAIMRRLKIQGYIVTDHLDMLGEFRTQMATWIEDGKMQWKETVFDGIENAPDALIGLFKGDNFGKMLVKIAAD